MRPAVGTEKGVRGLSSRFRVLLAATVGGGLVLLGLSGAATASTAGASRSAEVTGGASFRAAQRVSEEPEGRKVVLTISAVIDGKSVLTITGGKARWHHVSQAAPGRHLGGSLPTKIGKASWNPSWPADGENRDCNCNSNVFTGVTPPLPSTGPITFKAVSCRELCSAVVGGGKAVITVDDNATFSSAPYVVTLTYYVKDQPTISGTVKESTCAANACSSKGAPGVKVTATGSGGTVSDVTGTDGSYSFEVKKGTWTVTPSLGDRDFDPTSSTVVVDDDKVANFVTCAEERTTSSSGSIATSPCKKLAVSLLRVKGKGDSNWAETSGKRFIGRFNTYPVGFLSSEPNGAFRYQCRTGCMNIRLRVKDAKTKKALDQRVQVTAYVRVDGDVVTADSPDGVLCSAEKSPKDGCEGRTLVTAIPAGESDLDFYYWLPGVVETTKATLSITVRSKGYPMQRETRSLTLLPNVAHSASYTLNTAAADNLLWWGSAIKGISIVDFSSYCAQLLASLNDFSGSGLSAGERDGGKQLAENAEKKLETLGRIKSTPVGKACGVLDLPKFIQIAGKLAPWKLFTMYRLKLGIAPTGIMGNGQITSDFANSVINYAGFFDAFVGGLVNYLYDGFSVADPEAALPHGRDKMTVKVWEISHRLPSGKVKDALYLSIGGSKSGRKISKPSADYVEGGYWPRCWLDPIRNTSTFTIFENACASTEP